MTRDEPMSVGCIACGEQRTKRLEDVRDPQSLETFSIAICEACGLGRTEPVPEDLAAYYGPAYYGDRHSFTDRYCFARRARILERSAQARGRLLDIGCGDGSFLGTAKRRGWDAMGTEMGAFAETSRRKGFDVKSSPRDFPDAFDAITMWHTLEHFPDPSAIVREAREKIADRGRFIVAVPDAAGLQARVFRRYWFHLDVPRHLFHFSKHALGALLERTGFRVDRWHHQEIELDLFGFIQSTLNAVLPTPNALFQSLTGKPARAGRAELAMGYALGAALAPAALAATAVGTATGRGGTLVAVARPA